MVKLIFLCRRRPELTHAEYVERLLQGHVPLALRHHPSLRGYVVNVVEQSPPGMGALDSIGELWFDSLADYRERLYDSEAGREAIARDVAGFIAAADAYLVQPHVQKRPPLPAHAGERTPGVKMICPLLRRPDLDHAAFAAHWLGTHVPLARRHHPALRGYVTNVVLERLGSSGEPWDGFAALHFDSAETVATALFDSPEGERIVRDDIAHFIGRTGPYWVAEYVQKPPP